MIEGFIQLAPLWPGSITTIFPSRGPDCVGDVKTAVAMTPDGMVVVVKSDVEVLEGGTVMLVDVELLGAGDV
jgi:hypothetical protein